MPGPPAASRSPALLPGLLLAVTLHAFHAMAVATIAPLVAEDLDGRALYGAFFSVYVLASLLGLVWAGRRVGRAGPAPALRDGLLCFAAGLVGSGAAPGMEALVAARALEGFGGGAMAAVLYAAVNRAWPGPERPRVLAWMSGAWVLPGLLGPPLAGWVGEAWSWRVVFLGVAPGVGIAAALALPPLRRLGPQPDAAPDAAPAVAANAGGLGAALALAGGVGLLLHGLARLPAPAGAGLAALGAAVGVAAARRILPPGTLAARPGLPAAIATKTLLNFTFFGAEAFLPLALRDARGWSSVEVGAVLTAGALSWTTGAFVQSRLAARVGPAWLAAAGGLGIALGVAGLCAGLLGALPAPLSAPGVVAVWLFAGLGMGLGFNTTAVAAMAATAPGREGATSTALGLADALGFAVSAGLGGAVLAAGDRAGWPTAASVALVYGGVLVACLPTVLTALRLDAAGTGGAQSSESQSRSRWRRRAGSGASS